MLTYDEPSSLTNEKTNKISQVRLPVHLLIKTQFLVARKHGNLTKIAIGRSRVRQLDRQRDKNIDNQTKEQIKQTERKLKRKSETEHKIRRGILA